MEDLENGLIRILHEESFIDDATRIWRAVRYEQRLDFRMEPDTLRLLEQNIDMLETISADRIRHEFELVLREDFPEKAIRRAGELGVLEKLHPGLEGDDWLAEKYGEARKASFPDLPPVELYLALLAFRLTEKETEILIGKYRLRKSQDQVLRQIINLKSRSGELAVTEIAPSKIYSILHGCSRTALTAVSIAAGSPTTKEHIHLYLDKLRYVKPSLTGKDLQTMGIPPGPRMKEILSQLLEARLDGKVTDKKGEDDLVRG